MQITMKELEMRKDKLEQETRITNANFVTAELEKKFERDEKDMDKKLEQDY